MPPVYRLHFLSGLYQTALAHRTASEQSLRETLRAKDNELDLQREDVSGKLASLEQRLAASEADNSQLRALYFAEQRASSSFRSTLETIENESASLRGHVTKLKAENGILKANWQSERTRVLQLEGTQAAAVLRERDELRALVEKLQPLANAGRAGHESLVAKDSEIERLKQTLRALQAENRAKDNMIHEFDQRLADLQAQSEADKSDLERQNALIGELYRRLKDQEVNGKAEPDPGAPAARSAPSPSDSARLHAIRRDVLATRSIVCSLLGDVAPDPHLARAGKDGDEIDLVDVQAVVSDLYQLVSDGAASRLGDSCAMQ